jgi:hypothetical protein
LERVNVLNCRIFHHLATSGVVVFGFQLILAGLLACSSLLLTTRSATGTTFPAPRRELSKDERLEYAVSQAQAMVLGRILAVTDTIVLDTESAEVRYILDRFALVQDAEWLKGEGPSIIRVGARSSSLVSGMRAIVFLYRTPTRAIDRDPRLPWPYPPSAEWMASETPYGLAEDGVLYVNSRTESRFRGAVLAAMATQTWRSLLTRADLVVLARPVPGGAPCRVGDRDFGCNLVAIDSVLSGSSLALQPKIYSPVPIVVPSGADKLLLFLRHHHSDVYEVLSFRAGALGFRAGKTLGRKESQAEILKAVELAALAPPGRRER